MHTFICVWSFVHRVQVKPGQEIDVTGVYLTSFDAALNRKSGFPVFSTLVEASCSLPFIVMMSVTIHYASMMTTL